MSDCRYIRLKPQGELFSASLAQLLAAVKKSRFKLDDSARERRQTRAKSLVQRNNLNLNEFQVRVTIEVSKKMFDQCLET